MKNIENIKDKIQKLLNLSLSDNEHEASAAMQKAMQLMNDHNISREEVQKQPIITKSFFTRWVNTPNWALNLINSVCQSSACYIVYKNGYNSYTKKQTEIIITGRERDVENSIYVCEVLLRYCEKEIAKHRKIHTGSKNIDAIMQGYRIGLVLGVGDKLKEGVKKFFNTHTNGNELVSVDSRLNEAKDLYLKNNKVTINKHKSSATIDEVMAEIGYQKGKEISINQAVNVSEKRLLT